MDPKLTEIRMQVRDRYMECRQRLGELHDFGPCGFISQRADYAKAEATLYVLAEVYALCAEVDKMDLPEEA